MVKYVGSQIDWRSRMELELIHHGHLCVLENVARIRRPHLTSKGLNLYSSSVNVVQTPMVKMTVATCGYDAWTNLMAMLICIQQGLYTLIVTNSKL